MRPILLSLVLVIAAACAPLGSAPSASLAAAPSGSIVAASSASLAGPLSGSGSAECHPTLPNGDTPPGEDPGPNYLGNGRLYTGLWANGEILATPDFVGTDGSIGMKFPWWRAPGVGAAGDLQITGHERTSGATIVASIPDGYGQRFQASGITFPTEGCYEITARSGDAELTFEIRVTKVAGPSTSPGT